MLSRLALLAGSLFALALPARAARPSVPDTCHPKARDAFRHSTTVQAAVNEARSCDWVLIAPGIYRESVAVRTAHLYLRGINRDRGVLDGGHRPGNGVEVGSDDVWTENLTAQLRPPVAQQRSDREARFAGGASMAGTATI
jgi:pectin methylesterase-like acyl-CoA thioesterase